MGEHRTITRQASNRTLNFCFINDYRQAKRKCENFAKEQDMTEGDTNTSCINNLEGSGMTLSVLHF